MPAGILRGAGGRLGTPQPKKLRGRSGKARARAAKFGSPRAQLRVLRLGRRGTVPSLPELGALTLALGAHEDEVTPLLDPVRPGALDLAAGPAMLEGDIHLEGLSLKEDPAARE